MKIYGKTPVEVEIDLQQQKEITEKFLAKIFYINNDWSIEKGKLMREENQYSSHTWTEKIVVRQATKDDKLYLDFIKLLNKKYEKYKK